MSRVAIRMIAGAVLFGAWTFLAITGRTEIPPLVDFIKLTLVGLAVHVTKGDPKQ